MQLSFVIPEFSTSWRARSQEIHLTFHLQVVKLSKRWTVPHYFNLKRLTKYTEKIIHPSIADQVRSGQVILLLTISQSVSPSWPRVPNCDSWPYFSLEENFGIVFRGASTLTGGRGCHIQRNPLLMEFVNNIFVSSKWKNSSARCQIAKKCFRKL